MKSRGSSGIHRSDGWASIHLEVAFLRLDLRIWAPDQPWEQRPGLLLFQNCCPRIKIQKVLSVKVAHGEARASLCPRPHLRTRALSPELG